MTLSDRLAIWGIVVGVVGLVVTGIGFGLAIYQLKKTRNATEATKEAIERANRRMIYNHLLVLLPQIRTLEADLDAAIVTPDKIQAVRVLVQYSHSANQIAALLETDEDGHAVLVAQLRSTARAASLAKSDIVSGSKKTLSTLLHGIASEISQVSASCAGLSTTYQAKVA